MAKTSVTDWDTTAANNTDINSIDIDENCAPSGINNAIREQMAQIATAMTTGEASGIGHLAKSGAYTVLEADRGKCIDCSAALTLTLTAAATMQAGWMCYVKADGGAVTIDPNASETIDGSATYTVDDGDSVVIYTDGTAWYTALATEPRLTHTVEALDNTDSPYTVLATDNGRLLNCDTTGGTIVVNLLAAATAGDGYRLTVKRIDGTNSLYLEGDGSETIDSELQHYVVTDDEAVTVRCDGSNWIVESAVGPEIIDEDDMASDAVGRAPSQQSVKAYVGLAFIEEQTASATATIEFDLPTGYDHYMVVFESILPATDAAELYLRTSTDGGSTFDSGAAEYAYVSRGWDADASTDHLDTNTASAIVAIANQGNTSGTEEASGRLTIYGPSVAKRTNITWEAASMSTGGQLRASFGSGQRRAAEDVDAIQFLYSSGNIATGTFKLYGIL